MENNKVDAFLNSMGMGQNGTPESEAPKPQIPECPWDNIIQPKSSYLVLGDIGTGKSGLCHYLLERYGRKYNLQPAVVGLPVNKRKLLPDTFETLASPDDLTKTENVIAFVDEADIQLSIEDTKARKYVTNFLSLPRQRNQTLILAFHFPRLVLVRYLPFFAAFLLKRPPYLIEFASKNHNDAMSQMMLAAEERFKELVPPGWQPKADQLQPPSVVSHTYVVAPRIRWQGMIENPLPSFWSQDLSEVWSGTEIEPNSCSTINRISTGLIATNEHTPISQEMVARAVQKEPPNETHPDTSLWLDPFTNIEWYK